MNIQKSFGIVNRDLGLLAPFVKDKATSAIINAREAGYPVSIFEGFRTPYRQDLLYTQGRTMPGKIVTNAKAWRSWHQYSLAVDVAFYMNGKWSWDGDFDKVAPFFIDQGFKWLDPQEQSHFQIDGGFDIDYAYSITKEFGVQTLWAVVKAKLGLI